jgi:hypothetical protein
VVPIWRTRRRWAWSGAGIRPALDARASGRAAGRQAPSRHPALGVKVRLGWLVGWRVQLGRAYGEVALCGDHDYGWGRVSGLESICSIHQRKGAFSMTPVVVAAAIICRGLLMRPGLFPSLHHAGTLQGQGALTGTPEHRRAPCAGLPQMVQQDPGRTAM